MELALCCSCPLSTVMLLSRLNTRQSSSLPPLVPVTYTGRVRDALPKTIEVWTLVLARSVPSNQAHGRWENSSVFLGLGSFELLAWVAGIHLCLQSPESMLEAYGTYATL